MNSKLARRRAIASTIVFSTMAAIAFIALNLPVRFSRIYEMQRGQRVLMTESNLSRPRSVFLRSGFPWHYRVQIITQAQPMKVSPFQASPWCIVGNVLMGIMMVAAVAGYTWRRFRRIESSVHPRRVRLQYDITTVVIGFSIPLLGYAYSNRIANDHMRVADNIARHGQAILAAELPEWLATRMPDSMYPAFLRIRLVELSQPPSELVDQILRLRSLHGISFANAKIEQQELHRLGDCRELLEITIDRSQLATDTITDISNQDQLQYLAIRGCGLTQSDLVQLNRLRKLTQVDLVNSKFKLSEFDQSGWAGSVQTLRLSHPFNAAGDRLRLHDWMRLKQLGLWRSRENNESTVELHLASCPELKSIWLEHTQKYSLFAHALPSLIDLVEPFDSSLMGSRDLSQPSLPRWHCIALTDVPRLKRLECNVRDLESLRLSGMPRLREIAIGKNFVNPMFLSDQTPDSFEHLGHWITEVGALNDLRSLSLDGIRLSPAELEQIAAMKMLRQLDLSNCELTTADLDPIASMSSLEALNLHRCQLDQQRWDEFLQLPRLRFFAADISNIERFHVADSARLQQIETLPFQNLRSLRLKNLPRFSSGIVVQNSIQQISISQVPRLLDLTVECPWPHDFRLGKFTELQRFAAGGLHLDDRVLRGLLKCSSLDHLVLAYPTLSRHTLQSLGQLNTLTILEVPGCSIDDEVTSHWGALKRLRRVNFDDTKISTATAEWLRSLESLRSLSLNRLQLDRATCEQMVALHQLSEISLAETSIDDEFIARLLECSNLEFLDLSGNELTSEVLEALASARNLRTVFLMNVPLRTEQVQQMLAKNLRLRLVGSLNEDQLAELPENQRSRVYVTLNQYYFDRGLERAHRVMIHSNELVPGQTAKVFINRPFAVELFREQRQSPVADQ